MYSFRKTQLYFMEIPDFLYQITVSKKLITKKERLTNEGGVLFLLLHHMKKGRIRFTSATFKSTFNTVPASS